MKSTRFLNRFTLAIAALLCFGAVAPAQAADTDVAGQYIQALGNQALGIISNKALSKDQKQAVLEKVFSDNVDFQWVGRFVMGRFWRQATDEQKVRYLKEYQKFLIVHYTSRFTNYTSGTFKVTNTRDDGDGEFTVSMQMQSEDPDSEPVLVDYRVRKQDSGHFRIFDVIVEGVSMLATQRSEFSSVITDKGIDYLIDQLATRSLPEEAPKGSRN